MLDTSCPNSNGPFKSNFTNAQLQLSVHKISFALSLSLDKTTERKELNITQESIFIYALIVSYTFRDMLE